MDLHLTRIAFLMWRPAWSSHSCVLHSAHVLPHPGHVAKRTWHGALDFSSATELGCYALTDPPPKPLRRTLSRNARTSHPSAKYRSAIIDQPPSSTCLSRDTHRPKERHI